MTKRRLILVGKNRLSREGLKQILENDALTIVGSLGATSELPMLLRSKINYVDLILITATPIEQDDLETIREITLEFPETGIAILASSSDFSGYQAAVAAGARGFLPDTISSAALCLSLQLIALGENLCAGPTGLTKSQTTLITRSPIGKSTPLRTPLSAREWEILECLEDGSPNKIIARKLGIAEPTVKVHVKALLRKLAVDNRTQAAVWAMSRREPPPAQSSETL